MLKAMQEDGRSVAAHAKSSGLTQYQSLWQAAKGAVVVGEAVAGAYETVKDVVSINAPYSMLTIRAQLASSTVACMCGSTTATC